MLSAIQGVSQTTVIGSQGSNVYKGGIRPILRQSVRSFLQLVVIAFTIAIPLGWLAARRWLADFSYRTGIGLDVFLYSAVILLALALLAISLQTVRAALSNPVKSLRTE